MTCSTAVGCCWVHVMHDGLKLVPPECGTRVEIVLHTQEAYPKVVIDIATYPLSKTGNPFYCRITTLLTRLIYGILDRASW
jgi:hypothetical protein